MIDVIELKEKSKGLEHFLDNIELICKEIRLFSNCQPDHSETRYWYGVRESFIEILITFRPKSKEIRSYTSKLVQKR